MNERLNIRRMQMPERSSEALPFDLDRDITPSDRLVMKGRFAGEVAARRWGSALGTLSDLRILCPNDAPTFEEREWLQVIEHLRETEAVCRSGSAWARYYRTVADARIAYPQGVYILSDSADRMLKEQINRYSKENYAVFDIAASATIIFPDIPAVPSEEVRAFHQRLQQQLLTMSEPRSARDILRWVGLARKAAEQRIIAPQLKLEIGPEHWISIRSDIKKLRGVQNGDGLPSFASDIAIISAHEVKLTDEGMKLSFGKERQQEEQIPPAPQSLEL